MAGIRAGDLEADTAAWDAFVAASAQPTWLQDSAWATIKRPNGWHPLRVAADAPRGAVAGQVLVARRRGVPWGMGYLARGPVAAGPLDADLLEVFTRRLRAAAGPARLAYVRMEPDAPDEPALRDALRALGWEPADHVQPDRSRIIDLTADEPAILAGMHRKCRQSITKAERLGVRVVDADGDRLDAFYDIHTDAMRRAGIAPRTLGTYRAMWDVLAPRGMARLLFAESTETGEPVATLFLVACGPRMVDLYGGTTAEGGRLRANYLLKWEAIRRSKAAGATEYDLWGLPRAGIEQFKSGFGGTEIDYIGAWDLVTDPVGARVLRMGEGLRDRYRRWRYRDVHRPDAPEDAEPGSGGA
ncbi:MAG: peptidoglycan bridge formation glycyltransferase FemA/FemB family protein [Chloroflexi bacterium]|nr:peptidoglycan bridge formation glycyltransferase FemA/FemB family protein [Chloroflexota bacterium]